MLFSLIYYYYYYYYDYYKFFIIWDSFVIFVQAIQEVFVAEEWVKDARNEASVEANLRAEANKSLGAMK